MRWAEGISYEDPHCPRQGGTGKTNITAAFAAFAHQVVLADCEVDAADLHLVLEPSVRQASDFSGGRSSMRSAEDGMLVNEVAAARFDFDKTAARYDLWYRTPRGARYDQAEKRAIDDLLPSASDGGTLLEIGCGTGHFSQHFASRGFAVTGMDISKPMIAVARQKNIRSSTFELADAEHLPLADERFDVAVAITVLEFVCDPARVVSEMARCVKKPGGTLILGALNRLSAYNRAKQRGLDSSYASAHLFSPDDLRTLLRPFGASTIRLAGFVPRKDALIWLSPLLEWIGRLTANQHGAFVAARVEL